MPFPITSNMSVPAFKSGIIDHYFPHFEAGTAKQKELAQDYATIGAFLTSKASVLAALKGLENELRNYIVCTAPASVKEGLRTYDAANPVEFKMHKVLSNTLTREELKEGFNNPADFGVLHSKASLATGETAFDMAPAGRARGSEVAMPKKPPTIAGFDLHGMDFNRILLAHGYQFKDVAAGKDHGEYTHRLQWYAICHALALGDLTLNNKPIDIFRSMGALASKATANVHATRHLYLWEALFDNFKSQGNAFSNRTEAFCDATYNNPETLNLGLMAIFDPRKFVFDEKDVSNLFCLKVFLKIRFSKRERKEGEAYIDKLFKPGKTKTVTAAERVGVHDAGNKLTSAIYWYTA